MKDKKIKLRQPNIKSAMTKLRNLKWSDVKAHFKKQKKRRMEILEKRKNSRFSKAIEPYIKWMNRCSILLHVLLACIINFSIEAISRHSIGEAWSYMTSSPLVFLFNGSLIFVTFLVVYITRRRTFARILVSVSWLFLGVCNGYMLIKRVTPFNAQDLKVAQDAISLINSYFTGFELILLMIGIAALILWVISMWRRGGQYVGKVHRLLATAGLIVGLLGYMFLTKVAIDNRIVSNYFGNIAFAYQDYGFPYCFVSSIFNTGIAQPSEYTKETITNINKDDLTKATTKEGVQPNIVFIQLESFFDTNDIEFFTTTEDPLPNFRKIMTEKSSGYFKVPSVGAGTANTEFEVLTGMNLRYFGPGEYPYKTVLSKQSAESAATALKEFGYGTHALHNNGGNFYSRAKVFENIGFDTFTSKEFMNILQFTENGWSKDHILTQHILNAMDSTEQQDFVFGITVQGHGDYPEEKVLENPKIKVEGMEDVGRKNAWEYFVNQIYETDQFIGDLIAEFEKRGEPTVLVLYGDHLPTMDLESKDLSSRYLYSTNYAIWDNIGLEKKDRNIASYQIMSEVFEQLEIHSGTVFNYHQTKRKAKDYLLNLELLQYDILYGEQYIYEGKPPMKQGKIQMGILEVELSSIIPHSERNYSVYGENFTKSSKIFVNDTKQKSSFLNNTRMELQEIDLREGDIITVSQVGSKNTIFRTSKEYIYKNGTIEEVTQTEEAEDIVE